MNRGLWLIGGLGLGAGLMYILDPERGSERRALVREQAQTYRHWTDDMLAQTSRGLGQQTRSLGQQTRHLGQQTRGLSQWAYAFLAQMRPPLRYERRPDTRWLAHGGQMQGASSLLMLGCVGLGVGLMYMCDPQVGRRRRALVRDKALSYWQRTGSFIGKTTRDARNRTRGLVSGARTRLTSAEVPNDTILAARVRAQLGHVTSHASAIQVTAQQGRVTLRGPIPASEVDTLLSTTASVSGVAEVVNQLEVHAEAAHVAGVPRG